MGRGFCLAAVAHIRDFPRHFSLDAIDPLMINFSSTSVSGARELQAGPLSTEILITISWLQGVGSGRTEARY